MFLFLFFWYHVVKYFYQSVARSWKFLVSLQIYHIYAYFSSLWKFHVSLKFYRIYADLSYQCRFFLSKQISCFFTSFSHLHKCLAFMSIFMISHSLKIPKFLVSLHIFCIYAYFSWLYKFLIVIFIDGNLSLWIIL